MKYGILPSDGQEQANTMDPRTSNAHANAVAAPAKAGTPYH